MLSGTANTASKPRRAAKNASGWPPGLRVRGLVDAGHRDEHRIAGMHRLRCDGDDRLRGGDAAQRTHYEERLHAPY
jgi:hypothetical protein